MIKFNTHQACTDFYNSIKNQPDILRAIKSGEKYNYNKVIKTNGTLQLANNMDENDSSDD